MSLGSGCPQNKGPDHVQMTKVFWRLKVDWKNLQQRIINILQLTLRLVKSIAIVQYFKPFVEKFFSLLSVSITHYSFAHDLAHSSEALHGDFDNTWTDRRFKREMFHDDYESNALNAVVTYVSERIGAKD